MSARSRVLPVVSPVVGDGDAGDARRAPRDGRRERLVAAAAAFMRAAAPESPAVHLLESGEGTHLFLPDGSRLFDIDAATAAALRASIASGSLTTLLDGLGFVGAPWVDDTPLVAPPLHAISLAVAQKCNLGCTYCYAQQGGFGAPAMQMAESQALQAIDLLIDGAEPGSRLNIAFLGGEPLANRAVLRAATLHAAARAPERNVHVGFSITTNGTLLTAADGAFFEEHGFAVTVSLDGSREVHDAQRPTKGGRGSFDRIMRNVAPLLRAQRQMQVTARVTVTPGNLALREALDLFVDAGFHSVGFAPMLSSPSGQGEMQREDLEVMLGEMIDCGREYERRVTAGQRYPFANMANAMREIARGTHRPYPCGAGAGYLGVAADGALSACHRFVGDEAGAMGSVQDGIDRTRQGAWLADRHVHRQSPCTACWARYLCGGGCHHEVIARGRPACDYIRGWLHYCIGAFLRLQPAVEPRAHVD